MLEEILQYFPIHTHSLALVSDPDGLLADEALLSALVERGFTLIQEADPVLLRQRAEQARPFTPQAPVLIITPDALETLPYDLWQQGQHLSLALHSYFPNLAYPVLRSLSPPQRARLWEAPHPSTRLGRRGTIEFLLGQVFKLPANLLDHPADFITWLDDIHRQGLTPLPEALLTPLVERLQGNQAYAGWPLNEIFQSSQAFAEFVQAQWESYIHSVHEAAAGYAIPMPALIPFDSDPGLQDALSRLVRSGRLTPLQVSEPENLPGWAAPAIRAIHEDLRPKRIDELQHTLYGQLAELSTHDRWEDWEAIARAWAALTLLWYSSNYLPTQEQQKKQETLRPALDHAFLEWLRLRYTSLAAQRLPAPHQVQHVPYYLAYLRSLGVVGKVALLILDGLSLADWELIALTWRTRHSDWHYEKQLLLAQIPTITAISRLALASGMRPADLRLPGAPRNEVEGWQAFWGREGLPENAIEAVSLALDRVAPPAVITSSHLEALCLIDHTIDDILHGSVLGASDLQASLRLWLEIGNDERPTSARLEALLDDLLERGFSIFITSDHGHCEARGMGQPAEGLVAQTRGKRARLYDDRRAAQRVQTAFPETILWEKDGLLPDDRVALMPEGRWAFTTNNETVVTHGGLTLDEVVVPLVRIQKRALHD